MVIKIIREEEVDVMKTGVTPPNLIPVVSFVLVIISLLVSPHDD